MRLLIMPPNDEHLLPLPATSRMNTTQSDSVGFQYDIVVNI